MCLFNTDQIQMELYLHALVLKNLWRIPMQLCLSLLTHFLVRNQQMSNAIEFAEPDDVAFVV